MAALTGPRDSKKINPLGPFPTRLPIGLKSGQIAYGGGVVVADPANGGFGYPGKTATGLSVIGVANATADATAAGNGGVAPADGAVIADTLIGVFSLDNSTGADQITLSNIGQSVYLVDDHTVALTDGGETRSFAGTFLGFDPTDGVSVLVFIGSAIFAAEGSTGGSGAPRVQSGTVVLVAGTKTVNTGIELSAGSVVMITRKTQGGTVSATVGYEAPSASRVNGIPGVATLVFNAVQSTGAVATGDTSTLDYTIIG